MNRAIIIFQKNAVLGKVKTRLAADVGDEKALEIYRFLTDYTHLHLEPVDAAKFLFYSDSLEENSRLRDYSVHVQQGADLGERMLNAFQLVFDQGFDAVVIIGTDCHELKSKHVNEAFQRLESTDYVIGPAVDGGYYLLGTRQLNAGVFLNKSWSHADVLKEAIQSIDEAGLTHSCIELLSDIDTVDDLKELKALFSIK